MYGDDDDNTRLLRPALPGVRPQRERTFPRAAHAGVMAQVAGGCYGTGVGDTGRRGCGFLDNFL